MGNPASSGVVIGSRPSYGRKAARLILLGCLLPLLYFAGHFLGQKAVWLSLYKHDLQTIYCIGAEQARALFSPLSEVPFRAPVFTQSSAVDKYILVESPIAKAGLLANIGPSGSKSAGAKAGVVIASPSTSDPDYLYTWTRDAALVYKTLIDQYTLGEDTSLRTTIDDYVSSQAILQQVPNPSGNVSTGGLGEAKFHINLTAFTGPWGRPQRDGPSLRATALITYANWLIARSNTSFVTSKVWPVIKLDLDYTAKYWNQTGFDLWEEVSSSSFFTTAVQHRALREGIALASKLGQESAEYTTQADNVLCFLQSYWNPSDSYITSNTGGGRSGKDANSLLASIHTFDPAAGCDAATFQPCSDKALANLKVYVDSFRPVYPINRGIASTDAVATGRYPEDVYYGGNPWYLATAAVAEQLYDSLIAWKAQGSLNVTNVSLPFFRQFSPSVTPGTFASTTTTYKTLTTVVKTFADGFLAHNANNTPTGGALAEQFHRDTGVPLSARDLTWSYASALTAFNARAGKYGAGWGAKGLVVPSVCHPNTGASVSVIFTVSAETVLGENIYITGSVEALKNWSPDNALLLSAAAYPVWSITLSVPASTRIEYKYIRKHDGGVKWESDPNNVITTPARGILITNDTWR